jgi:cytochrome c
MEHRKGISGIVLVGLLLTPPVWAGGDHADKDEDNTHGAQVTRLLMPIMSSSRGTDLFVSKGCVACHAVNGVGGHDSASLDAHDMDEFMNPFDLAAKMWTMAPYMIEAQNEALGEQILFSGEELADIIAFLHDDRQQHTFTEANLTPQAMKMMDHGHGVGSGAEEHQEEIGHGQMGNAPQD